MNLVAQINILNDKLKKICKPPRVVANVELFHKHETDAGHDIKSSEDIAIEAKGFVSQIHTSVRVEIPVGYFGLVKERSSMAAKGILVMGGVIDSGYRGEILVNLANVSGYDYVIKTGDRIAQLIILPCSAVFEVGDIEENTERGVRGFGSTGK